MKGWGQVTGGDGLFAKGLVPRRGPAQPSNLNRLTESGTQDLPTHSQAFPSESVPPARPNDLCVECSHRPRAAGGKLSRCIPCIKVEAALARIGLWFGPRPRRGAFGDNALVWLGDRPWVKQED